MINVAQFLTFLNFEYKKDGRKYSKFKCICGNIKILLEQNVKRGLTKSCGCMSAKLRRESNPRSLSLDVAKEIAKSRGGDCLSVEYTNCETLMLWRCKNGHEWKARLNDIKNKDYWCPYCSYNAPLTIEIAHKIAKEKGGICLSNEYVVNKKLLWRCAEGHEWDAFLPKVKFETWCPFCAGIVKLSIDDCIEIARNKGGKCLSDIYININTPMLWECGKGHVWKARLNDIKNGNQWCPICAKDRRKKTNMLKYGADHPMKNMNVAKKCARNQTKSCILYHWKTGEELVCQASWEKSVVEYFNANQINFRWQHKIFTMLDGRTYRPDCYLYSTKKWIEIKGYFRKDAREKWEWFQAIKPNSELWNKKKLKQMGIL